MTGGDNCLPDPHGGDTPFSIVHVTDGGDGYVLPGDICEIVYDAEGNRLAHLVPDPSWEPVPAQAGSSVTGALLHRVGASGPLAVVVKKRPIGPDTPDALLRWQAEVAAYDTSRRLHAGGSSFAEDVNNELGRVGHPGRLPQLAAWWLDSSDRRKILALAVTRLDGVTIRSLLLRHPEGLPPASAAAVVQSMSHLLGAAHRVGVRLGDISPNNILVCGDIADPASLFVNFVDLELCDQLAGVDPEDRNAWWELVDPGFRWRVLGAPLTNMVGYTGRQLTYLERHPRLGFETDIGYLGVVARALFAGSSRVDVPLPATLPLPLRWMLSQLDRTGDLAERIRSGRAPELASATAFGDAVAALTPRATESEIEYLMRVEERIPHAGEGFADAVFEWADKSSSPQLRIAAARLAVSAPACTLAGDDQVRRRRTAADILAAVSQAVGDDGIFVDAVTAAGLVELDRPLGDTTLAGVVAMLSNAADQPVLERVDRLWPGAAPRTQTRRPTRSNSRSPFLSAAWLDQFVAHAPLEAAEGTTPGLYSMRVLDDPDLSFTFTIDEDGRLASIVRGTTIRASATTSVSAATLADHLDGTAYFPQAPSAQWTALHTLAKVAPPTNVVRDITEPATWPTRNAVSERRLRVGEDDWLDDLVIASSHLATCSDAPHGKWTVDVVDDPAKTFTFVVSQDRRLVGWHRSASSTAPTRTTAIRRERLVELLRSRPRQTTVDAVSVLCRVAADIAAFTELTPARQEFLTPGWLTEFLCRTRLAMGDAAEGEVVVAPAENLSLAFEVATAGGAVATVRPVDPNDPANAERIEVVSAGRLWDVVVEGHTDAVAEENPSLRLLAAVRPTDTPDFTAPSQSLSVPPGEQERERRRAIGRRLADERRQRTASDRAAFAAMATPVVRLFEATVGEVERHHAGFVGELQAVEKEMRELLADALLDRDRVLAEVQASIDAAIDETAAGFAVPD